jgi:hypothetical protein
MGFFCLLYLFSNLGLCFSFLNHWAFSHEYISDYSFTTTYVVMLGALDPAALNLLTQDDLSTLYVKRATLALSLLLQLLPTLLLQISVVFFVGFDLDKLEEASGLPDKAASIA